MSIFDKLKALLGLSGENGASTSDGMAGDMVEMISCEDALRLVHEYLDGELERVPEAQVKEHFDMCQRCYPHLQLENAFRDAVRRAASGEAAPAALKAKVAAMIAEAEAEG